MLFNCELQRAFDSYYELLETKNRELSLNSNLRTVAKSPRVNNVSSLAAVVDKLLYLLAHTHIQLCIVLSLSLCVFLRPPSIHLCVCVCVCVCVRYERLEDQLNDLTELHQHETINLKQELASIEEKVAYQAYERARDIQVMCCVL